MFFTTSRNFNPIYSDLDNTFIYANSTTIAVATLSKDSTSLLAVKNDSLQWDGIKEHNEKAESKSKKKNLEAKIPTPPSNVVLDPEGFEDRVEFLDVVPGNIGDLSTTDGRLLFMRRPNTGASDDVKSSLHYYDFKERKDKKIIDGISTYQLAEHAQKVLIHKDESWGVVDITDGNPVEAIDKKAPLDKLMIEINPREEWKQIFADTWRMVRDFFYDPNLHGVDWTTMKSHYGDLIDQAGSRADVNFIIGELIAELNSSHTYRGGGDLEDAKNLEVGYLGADFQAEGNNYKISKIIDGAAWDTEVRSPLNKPGIHVVTGDYLLAVNGQKVDTSKPISAWLQGMANKTVELTIGKTPDITSARNIAVHTLDSETRLRHLSWIENNRKRVDEATNGKIGYVYVPSTGVDGQDELIRQYYAQLGKEGMIIDERFNSGGQIPDRFIEILNRKPLAFWAVRDGEDWNWPPASNFGPKVMLINGFSGSGGDAFPDYFRKSGLGPLIGTRTWGGLIGISGAPALIDNGGITVPSFRMYNPDGTWFKEGHGVDPDIQVMEDFARLAKGTDVQLEAAIKEVMRLLQSDDSFKKPERPPYENRN